MSLCDTCSKLGHSAKDLRPKIAVLGGGIAGLTAAHELSERGFAVDVFEGAGEVGGLAATQHHYSDAIFGEQADRCPLPGEHGFRAFYSFYRHLTDTMQRIPLWDRLVDDERAQDNRRPHGPHRSVADNLIPTYKVAVALEDNMFREIEYDRRQPRSAAAASYALGVWMVAMGFPSSDIVRLLLRLFQFLTSCRERRYHELAGISLLEYLGGDLLSPRFKAKFKNISRFLVAIDPKDGDALTQAMIMCRLLMDPVVSGEAERNVDRVLNGPTDERWLDPWHFFLQQQKVRFFFGQHLHQFALQGRTIGDAELVCGTRNLKPGTPPCDNEGGYWLNMGRPRRNIHRYQYFVAAVPGDVLSKVLARSRGVLAADAAETAAMRTRDEKTLATVTDEDVMRQRTPGARRNLWLRLERALAVNITGDPSLREWVRLVPPHRRVRRRRTTEKANYRPWMSGIQFYLSDNVTVLPGHIHFPDSKWALTAVCQSQFWGGDFYWRYGKEQVRSIISVDICDFEAAGEFVKGPDGRGKKAVDCSPTEIAAEVWYQMREGLKAWDMVLPRPYPLGTKNPLRIRRQRPLSLDLVKNRRAMKGRPASPIPLPYLDHHIDERITFTLKGDRINQAKTFVQYFVPGRDSWKARPGPLPPLESWDQGYRIRLGTLVVIGHFAQTFTSINTMEAANESARHGVNAILADYERVVGGRQGRYVHLERCTVWPLEADEPANLDFWKDVDRNIFWDDENNRPKPGRPPHLFETLKLDDWVEAMLPNFKNIDNAKFSGSQLWDSDGWKRFEKGFGGLWDKLLTLGRFSTPYS